MNDNPNIRFVDSHTESIRCDNHRDFTFFPRLLFLFSLKRSQSGMIKISFYSLRFQKTGQLFRSRSFAYIHDCAGFQTG